MGESEPSPQADGQILAEDAILGMEEAQAIVTHILPNSIEEHELLDLTKRCLTAFIDFEKSIQGTPVGEEIDALTNRFTLVSGSIALFTKIFKRYGLICVW